MRLRELATSLVRFGYRRLTVLLRPDGWRVNAKRIHRLYTEEGLWSMDFVSVRVADGRWFRIFTVMDQFTQACLCLVADQSLTGEKAAQALEPLVAQRGATSSITVDMGANSPVGSWMPEPTATALS